MTSSYTDLQDYTYYFVPAPWLSVKLLRLLQNYPPPEDPSIRTRLTDCLETILNKAQVGTSTQTTNLLWALTIKFGVSFSAISIKTHFYSIVSFKLKLFWSGKLVIFDHLERFADCLTPSQPSTETQVLNNMVSKTKCHQIIQHLTKNLPS